MLSPFAYLSHNSLGVSQQIRFKGKWIVIYLPHEHVEIVGDFGVEIIAYTR
jgi:hypothetical protein